MKRASASLWSCHTTSSPLVWTSPLLRASTPPTQGLANLTPPVLMPTAPFYPCDADQVRQLMGKTFESSTQVDGLTKRVWVHAERHAADNGATKEERNTLQETTPAAAHVWMFQKTLRQLTCEHFSRWLEHLEDNRITTYQKGKHYLLMSLCFSLFMLLFCSAVPEAKAPLSVFFKITRGTFD